MRAENDRHEELSQVLQQRAALVSDVEQQKAALIAAAMIEEEILGRIEASIVVYRRVLEVDGEDHRALDALIRLFNGLQRWPDLLAAYAKKAELTYEPEARVRLYYQVGAIYENELGDVPSAIATYQQILELDPDDVDALGRLDTLYQETEKWPELLSVVQHMAELAPNPLEALVFQFRIAQLYDRKLEDVSRAIDLYRELLSEASDHAPTIEALEALTKDAREPVAAALVLESIYQATGDCPRLIAVLEVQVAKSQDVFSRVELLTRIAGLYEDSLNEPGAAFDTLARAIAVDSANEDLLAQYERLAAFAGRWAELAASST